MVKYMVCYFSLLRWLGMFCLIWVYIFTLFHTLPAAHAEQLQQSSEFHLFDIQNSKEDDLEIAADSIKVSREDTTLQGNVVFTRGDMRILSDRALVVYTEGEKRSLSMIIFESAITIKNVRTEVQGGRGEYDIQNDKIVLVDGVEVTMSSNDNTNNLDMQLIGDHIHIDMDNGSAIIGSDNTNMDKSRRGVKMRINTNDARN